MRNTRKHTYTFDMIFLRNITFDPIFLGVRYRRAISQTFRNFEKKSNF